MVEGFFERGWLRFPYDPVLAEWVAHAHPAGLRAVANPAHAHWLDCEGTWFVGVDALDNDAQGRVAGSAPLAGQAIAFIAQHLGDVPLHKAQLSVVYPGYPKSRARESEAAGRYRARRDAAHVDGLKPSGPDRRRHVDEPHAWILGIPLTNASADAAPLVVWDGSHKIMGTAFAEALCDHPSDGLARVDVTDAYQAARREVFDQCQRLELHARPGEAILLHRHCLHGVAPWKDGASASEYGRMIAYFRPELPGGVAEWIATP